MFFYLYLACVILKKVSILVKFGFSNQRLSIGFGQRIKNIGHSMDLTLQLRSHSVWQVRQTTTNDPRLPVGKVMKIVTSIWKTWLKKNALNNIGANYLNLSIICKVIHCVQ